MVLPYLDIILIFHNYNCSRYFEAVKKISVDLKISAHNKLFDPVSIPLPLPQQWKTELIDQTLRKELPAKTVVEEEKRKQVKSILSTTLTFG